MSSVELQSPPSGWLVWYGRLLEGVVMALMVILFLEVMIGVVFRMAGHSYRLFKVGLIFHRGGVISVLGGSLSPRWGGGRGVRRNLPVLS